MTQRDSSVKEMYFWGPVKVVGPDDLEQATSDGRWVVVSSFEEDRCFPLRMASGATDDTGHYQSVPAEFGIGRVRRFVVGMAQESALTEMAKRMAQLELDLEAARNTEKRAVAELKKAQDTIAELERTVGAERVRQILGQDPSEDQ